MNLKPMVYAFAIHRYMATMKKAVELLVSAGLNVKVCLWGAVNDLARCDMAESGRRCVPIRQAGTGYHDV